MFDKSNLWKFSDDNQRLEYAFASDIKNAYEDLFKKIFDDINLESHTPQGQIISYLAEQDLATISAIQDIFNYFFLGGNGSLLDIWAYNQYRAKRKSETLGYVVMDLQGVANTLIPKGFKVSNGAQDFICNTAISLNDEGKAKAMFYQSVFKSEIALANTITQIVTENENVERVFNENSSIAGQEIESDSDFYARCQMYGSLVKNSSFASVLSNVAQVNGVTKIGGFENSNSFEVIERGFTLNPHSFVVIVSGGNDKDIALALKDAKPCGAGMMGNTSVELEIFNNKTTYTFERPSIAELQAEIQVKTTLISP